MCLARAGHVDEAYYEYLSTYYSTGCKFLMRTEHTGYYLDYHFVVYLDIEVSSLGICGTLFQHLVFRGFYIINHCKTALR